MLYGFTYIWSLSSLKKSHGTIQLATKVTNPVTDVINSFRRIW